MDPSQDWMSGSRIQVNQTLEYTASSLESDRSYTFSVAAVREGEGGEGPRGPAVTIKTLCIEVVPQMVTTTLTVTNDVTVTWQKPTVQCSTGITQFTIYYEIEGDVTSRQEAGTADPNAESFTVDGSLLEPGMTYNIAVTVTTDQESALSEGRTVTATKPTGSSGSSVAIIIIGVVIVVLIVLILLFLIVIVVRKRKMEDQPDPIDNQPLNDIGNRSGPSGNTYHSPGAVNTALNVTEANKTKERSAANSSVLDVGGIYGNLEPPSPIRIAEFPEYIISNIDKVEHEFGLLEGVQQKHPWTVAEEEYNRKKNRFRNMYPYDHCRVVLPKLPGDHHSDYYNASFILNERDVRAYIASQGKIMFPGCKLYLFIFDKASTFSTSSQPSPVPTLSSVGSPNKASVDDFWRLIWEQNVQTIVMLANLYEDTKERCLQYWPKEENEIQYFGYINVTWTKTQHFADYVIRTLSVDRGGTIREVKQLHFKEWPDKDVPDSATCLVEFARHCKLIHFKKQTPLLIHCSAGIGRTGTFIGLLSMMDVLQSKEYIDIFAFVNKMRENRVNMIQTKKQYRYLHTCLYEFHLTRDCQISAQILSRFKIHDNKAAILREFELLSEVEMSKTNDSIKTGATTGSLTRGNSTDSLETGGSMKTEHAPRDRFGNMVPTGRRKVFMLSSSPSNPDNYINASFVKSYEKKDAFITTQSPLPNTIEDFWRMIYDHKCRTVVMLNQLDGSDKTCVQYWPDRGSLQYGIMTVTCIATDQQSDYVKRTFDVSLNDSANVISVTHLQLEEWPPNGSPQSVIRLITDAQKLQKEANVEKPLVVHCINGFGRSGVFVTVQSEMERIRATGLVDIFATVKKLRNEHQHMMRKKAAPQSTVLDKTSGDYTANPADHRPRDNPEIENLSNPKAKVTPKTYNRAKGKAPKAKSVAKGRAAPTAGASVVPSDPQDQTVRSASVSKEPGTRSRSPVRRPSPIPDESSPDSDTGFRRKRHRRSTEAPPPPTGPPSADCAWLLSQLTSVLSPLVQHLTPATIQPVPDRAESVADIPPAVREYPTQLGTVPPRVPRNLSSIAPDPDALEIQASETFSELGDRLRRLRGRPVPRVRIGRGGGTAGHYPATRPHREVANIFKQRLGFEDSPAGPSAPKSSSKLRSTNETPEDDSTSIPVDPLCFERVEVLQKQRRWTAFPAKQDKALRVPEDTWKNLFHPPSIPRTRPTAFRNPPAKRTGSGKLASGRFKEKLANLPILGEDLFDGQFGETVKNELERRETLSKSGFSRPDTRRGERQSRPYRRPDQSRPPRGRAQRPAYWKRGSGNAAKSFRGGRPDRSPRRSPRGHRYGRLSRDERPRPRRDDQPPRSSFGAPRP
ncbi:putative receptor-type tyrosine-protein phosphatase alpha [Apostichopus japonicus]|uniref:protein-tyrosine-phosphatase n=1 Tax=Stichopus japonicus TaxID=307972 RepID=A0A2G8JRG2_STIJA|nr:putative receptor-type tyrosine-protein phosphatase alpha [Apostichopus japonicus]